MRQAGITTLQRARDWCRRRPAGQLKMWQQAMLEQPDPLAGKMWATMMDVLREIGALPQNGSG